MIEQVERRTRNSKTHSLGGQKYAWDGTIGAIHYEDNGWQEIDNIFESAVAPWDWQMLKAGYHVRVKEDFTAGQIIEFEKQGETVQFQPMALEWTNDIDQIQAISMPADVTPVITNPEVDLLPAVGMASHRGTIKWNDAYGDGIDFEWVCCSTRLIKRLEVESLSKLPTPEQYIIDGGNPVLRLNLIFDPSSGVDIYVDGDAWNKRAKKRTFSIIEFWKDGEVLWGFMPLRYWGSGEGEDNNGQSIATLEKRGNSLYVSIRVPYDWLQNAIYPVFIDTDIDEQVGASSDDCWRRLVGSYTTLTSPNNPVGDYGSTAYDYRSGMRFTTVDVPNGATIDAAYLSLKAASYESNIVNSIIYGEDDDDAVTFNDVDADFDDRIRTAASANWTPAAWVTDTWYNSSSIATIIKEIVDRDGWSSGNALVIFWQDPTGWANQDKTDAYAWDDNPANAPKLHIEYSAGAVAALVDKSYGMVI